MRREVLLGGFWKEPPVPGDGPGKTPASAPPSSVTAGRASWKGPHGPRTLRRAARRAGRSLQASVRVGAAIYTLLRFQDVHTWRRTRVSTKLRPLYTGVVFPVFSGGAALSSLVTRNLLLLLPLSLLNPLCLASK